VLDEGRRGRLAGNLGIGGARQNEERNQVLGRAKPTDQGKGSNRIKEIGLGTEWRKKSEKHARGSQDQGRGR